MAFMIGGLAEWATVLAVLTVAYSLPAWRLAARIASPAGWPAVLLGSIVLGTGSQAILGMIWGRFVADAARFEFSLYLALWLLVNAVLLFRKSSGGLPQGLRRREAWSLAAILAAAVAVRSIHPLQYMALGQSDAYTHLIYLRNILSMGHLHNITYPPGFHWVLGLPTWLFRLDPYDVCRFGGAFFGTGLVLALYVLLRRYRGEQGALGGAFLAAAFPGFTLLIKTGVGVFANQYGIFLLPVILWCALRWGEEKLSASSPWMWMLMLSLAALAVSVPMMLLHVIWVLIAAALLSLLTPGTCRPSLRLVLVLFLAPAVVLAALHFSQLGTRALSETLNAISVGGGAGAGGAGPGERGGLPGEIQRLLPYVKDYFVVKRFGFESNLMNLAGAGLLLAFLLTAGIGIRTRDPFFRLLGAWGLIGTLHVLFGLLQFSAYQREGWSLLVAAACLGGVIAGILYRMLGPYRAGRFVYYSTAAGMLAVTALRPPGHVFLTSGAEEEIVRLVRSVQEEGVIDALGLREGREDVPQEVFTRCGAPNRKWAVVTRQFIQWGIVEALVDTGGLYIPAEVRKKTRMKRIFRPGRCHLVILERAGLPDPDQLGVLSAVNKPLLDQFAHLLGRYRQTQKRLEKFLSRLTAKGWTSVKVSEDASLEVRILIPPEGGRSPRGQRRSPASGD